VTSTAIARRANADPALVRYYFGNRENLLFEVANQIGAETNRPPPDAGDPVELLVEMVHNTFRFTRSAKHMQRLMIEELDSASSPEVRSKMREWNRVPLSYYAKLQELDGEGKLRAFDPVFMHLAVVGISDFFASGAPLVELLVPEGTDMEELGRQYEDFVTRLVTDGLRKR
jgi:AcrR family transcriptional regulator